MKLPGLCEVWRGYRSGRWASVWCLGIHGYSWLPVRFNDDGNDENSENRHFQDTQGVNIMGVPKNRGGKPPRIIPLNNRV